MQTVREAHRLGLLLMLLILTSCGGGGGGGGGTTVPTASTDPVDNASISGSTPIVIRFNTSMDPGSLVLTGTLAALSDGGAWTATSLANDTLTISPSSSWSGTNHTLIIDVSTASGTVLATISLNYAIDLTLPVASVAPGNNARINGNQTIVITFTESMDPATLAGAGVLWSNGDGGAWSTTSVSNDTLTLSPASSWPAGAADLTIDIDDLAGNPLAQLVLNYTVDLTAPTGVPTPTSGGILAGADTITIVYDESMDAQAPVYAGSLSSEADTGSWSTTSNIDDTLTISPVSSWSLGAQTLDVTAADLAGNSSTLNLSYSVEADVDGDGFSTAVDCNDNDPDVHPGAAELCNGVDDDCDAATADGSGELWNNQACDGADTDFCTEGTFSCSAGLQVCSDNTGDDIEICDNVDNDCDGSVDEGNPEGGGACDTGLQGVCAAGTQVCTLGSLVCTPDTTASTEVCDNLDNDCDGSVDNNPTLGSYPNSTTLCVGGIETLQCAGGYDDCDTQIGNGCEANILSDPGNCGFCLNICFDSNTCTNDACSGGSCNFSNVPDATPCDDGNGGTINDQCTTGVCSGDPCVADSDGDGICDANDSDDDNDGVPDVDDSAPLDPTICQDLDGDACDDCAIGTDGFGPLADFDTFNDGTDADMDGICAVTDCDDTRNTVYPGAFELCDGLLNDCNGGGLGADEIDDDSDGYVECTLSGPWAGGGGVVGGDDCDDTSDLINPGATEICDTIDNDCDGLIDQADPSVDLATCP